MWAGAESKGVQRGVVSDDNVKRKQTGEIGGLWGWVGGRGGMCG